MRISELEIHFLAVPQGYYLALPISADMSFNSGISQIVNNQYDLKDKLTYFYGNELDLGEAYLIDNVYSLVIKETSDDEPELEMLMDAISEMHDDMNKRMIKKLAIPKACFNGNDNKNGLGWNEVQTIIEEEFDESDIDILICTL